MSNPPPAPLNFMSHTKTQRCLYLAHYISWDWVITYFVNWGPYYSLGWCYVTVIATIYIVFDPGDKRLQIREYLAFKSASHIHQKGQVFWISFRYDWPWSEPVYFILIYWFMWITEGLMYICPKLLRHSEKLLTLNNQFRCVVDASVYVTHFTFV